MSLPDNRIRLPAPKIDFDAEVGTTGQDHDNYPEPGLARYDHMRSYLIGLLANQASYSEPVQYRDGSLWFDLNTNALRIRLDGDWRSLASVIPVVDGSDPNDITTLADWYAAVADYITSFAPEVTFSGRVTADTTQITIPESLRSSLGSSTRCFLYVNGLLIDPRLCTIAGTPPTTINISGNTLESDDEFTVSLRNILSQHFYASDVVIP